MLSDDKSARRQFEQHGLPLWLQPIHIRLLPLNASFVEPCQALLHPYDKLPLRIEIDDRNLSVAAKLKAAHNDLVPKQVVIGQKEVDDNYGDLDALGRDGFYDAVFR